ncbi:hypothetical protein NC651_036584 [Populus alba x Populus x berolinensis]|nr:hypothetical protein NC651_036584 [Populus alba x Populus x berolinensis]
MRTRNSIDTPRPSPPEDPSQGNYYTHLTDFHHLLKPANGLSGKATNSLGGDMSCKFDCAREQQKIQAFNDLAKVATTKRSFHSLSNVDVENCLTLRNLIWLTLAQNHTFLGVSNCPKLVEVAGVEKRREVPEVVEIDKLPSYSEKLVERAGEMAEWSYQK